MLLLSLKMNPQKRLKCLKIKFLEYSILKETWSTKLVQFKLENNSPAISYSRYQAGTTTRTDSIRVGTTQTKKLQIKISAFSKSQTLHQNANTYIWNLKYFIVIIIHSVLLFSYLARVCPPRRLSWWVPEVTLSEVQWVPVDI